METPLERQKRIEEEEDLELLSKFLGMEEEPKPTNKRGTLTDIEREEARCRLNDERKKRAKLTEEQRIEMIKSQEQIFAEAASSFDYEYEVARARRFQQEAAEKQRQMQQEAAEKERRMQQEAAYRNRRMQQEAEMIEKKRQAQILANKFQREKDEMQLRHAKELQGLRLQYNEKLYKFGFKLPMP
jgi:hypothetical protein